MEPLNKTGGASGVQRFLAPALRIVLIALALMLSLNAQAQSQKNEIKQSPDGKTWTVNIRNADIEAFISQVSQMTGKNFVIDPRVRAKDVTVISQTPLTAKEVYQLFLAVLQVHGYAAVPSGNVVKIVTNTTAKQDNLPFKTGSKVGGEQLITQVIPVKNSPVEELVPVLRPLVPQYGHLAAVSSANALIISDHADNIQRIRAIVRQLDQSDNDQIQIVQLQHAYAGNLVQLLQNLTQSSGTGNRRNASQNNATVVADDRTNAIILKGDKSVRERLVPLIHRLDTPSAAAGGVSVVRLAHGNAEDMAKLLKNFAAGVSQVKEGGAKNAAGGGSSDGGSGVSIQADKSLNALVIRAQPEMMQQLQSVIGQLDVRRAQILIEAAIVEISGNKASQLGFQYVAGNTSSGIGAVNFNNGNSVSVQSLLNAVINNDPTQVALGDGLLAGFGKTNGNGGLEWGALIQALASTSNANLLSTPSILTLDNQEASIIVGENVPFVTGQSTSTGSGVSNPFQTIERKDVGLTLKVTPHVSGSDSVRLKLDQETSAVKNTPTLGTNGIVTTKRELKTTVLADDRQTIVLGGLISDDVQTSVSKVPILGDIPLIGALFRSTSKQHQKRNLMVFIRPTILADNDRLVSMTKKKYMGVTAMQFSVDDHGNLVRDVNFPLPTKVDNLFEGRTQVSKKFRKAYEKQQHLTPDQSAAPTTDGPTTGDKSGVPGGKASKSDDSSKADGATSDGSQQSSSDQGAGGADGSQQSSADKGTGGASDSPQASSAQSTPEEADSRQASASPKVHPDGDSGPLFSDVQPSYYGGAGS